MNCEPRARPHEQNKQPLIGKMVKRSQYQQPEGNKAAETNPIPAGSHCESNYASPAAATNDKRSLISQWLRWLRTYA